MELRLTGNPEHNSLPDTEGEQVRTEPVLPTPGEVLGLHMNYPGTQWDGRDPLGLF